MCFKVLSSASIFFFNLILFFRNADQQKLPIPPSKRWYRLQTVLLTRLNGFTRYVVSVGYVQIGSSEQKWAVVQSYLYDTGFITCFIKSQHALSPQQNCLFCCWFFLTALSTENT